MKQLDLETPLSVNVKKNKNKIIFPDVIEILQTNNTQRTFPMMTDSWPNVTSHVLSCHQSWRFELQATGLRSPTLGPEVKGHMREAAGESCQRGCASPDRRRSLKAQRTIPRSRRWAVVAPCCRHHSWFIAFPNDFLLWLTIKPVRWYGGEWIECFAKSKLRPARCLCDNLKISWVLVQRLYLTWKSFKHSSKGAAQENWRDQD